GMGGHVDYAGNELYGIDLSVAPTGKVFRLDNATPGAPTSGTTQPESLSDGRPVARHTYGGFVYDPVRDSIFIQGGSGAPSGFSVYDSWELSLANLPASVLGTWTHLHTAGG